LATYIYDDKNYGKNGVVFVTSASLVPQLSFGQRVRRAAAAVRGVLRLAPLWMRDERVRSR
jgi:hypothetical protein